MARKEGGVVKNLCALCARLSNQAPPLLKVLDPPMWDISDALMHVHNGFIGEPLVHGSAWFPAIVCDRFIRLLHEFRTHWITDSFERKSAVLQVLWPLEGSHTQENAWLRNIWRCWQIGRLRLDQVHLVLRDNAANVAKAMRDASLPSTGCFAHTLQLVVHDRMLSQWVVMETLADCRKNCWPFYHCIWLKMALRQS